MYQLVVLTPNEIVYDDEVVALIAPGSLGYLGILTGHAPLITTLKPGIFVITSKHKEKHFYRVSGGFLEVKNSKAVLLADSIQATSAVEITGPI